MLLYHVKLWNYKRRSGRAIAISTLANMLTCITLGFPINNSHFQGFFSLLLCIFCRYWMSFQYTACSSPSKCSFNASQILQVTLETKLQHSFLSIMFFEIVIIGGKCPPPRICWLHRTNVYGGYSISRIKTMVCLAPPSMHEERT